MSLQAALQIYEEFTQEAEPYLNIRDDAHYEEVLGMIEHLITAGTTGGRIVDILSDAVKEYEAQDDDLVAFDIEAHKDPAEIVALRFIMDQHQLGVADLPELGDKSLISRILNGKRNLTKSHIDQLITRFEVDPAIFFDSD